MDLKTEPNESTMTRPTDPFSLISKFTVNSIEAIEAGRPYVAIKILSVLRKFSDCIANEGWWNKLE